MRDRETVEAHFSIFKNNDDAELVDIEDHFDAEMGRNFTKLIPKGKGPKKYIRIGWLCPQLTEAARQLDVGDTILVSVSFSELDFAEGDVNWMAFMKSSEDYKYSHANQTKSQIRNVDSDILDFKFELSRLQADEQVQLMFHFDSLCQETILTIPDITWSKSDCLGIINAEVKDQILTVKGWAKHPSYPGVPVRLTLNVDGVAVDEVLARTEQKPSEYDRNIPSNAYLFSFFKILPFMEELPEIEVVVEDGKIRCYVDIEENSEQEVETVEEIPVLTDASSIVIGKVEAVSSSQVVGWALHKNYPDVPVELVLEVDSMPFSHVKCSIARIDVQSQFGGNGYAGFSFEIPPNMRTSPGQKYSIRSVEGITKINKSEFSLNLNLNHFNPSEIGVSNIKLHVEKTMNDQPISAIVLNNNGRDLLIDMFASAEKVEDISLIEWIIIDHNSTDDSEAVALEAAESGHNVKFIKRKGNFSFSDSNNFGAKHASHETLIFLNNDLIFLAPFVNRIQNVLSQSDVGAVGSILYDYVDRKDWMHRLPIQHLGVAFGPEIKRYNWLRPYEIRAGEESFEDIGHVVEKPVVTGAFLAMKAKDFKAIGQFETDYIYGLEDVDLCMKVLNDLGKKVVSDNTLRIAHHRGFSRRKEKDVVVRQRNNNNFFNKRWGTTIRMNAKKDVLARPSYWGGAKPVIGFIVADAGDKTTAGEYYTALELGKGLQKIFPCHLRFLTKDNWYNLSGIDILIVMVATFDINKVRVASPFLVTVNWTRQWFDRWAADESMQTYDFVLASSERAANYMNEHTGRDVTVVPIASNFEHFSRGTAKREYRSDYCFTGNYVGTTREIQFQLDPESINAVGAVYGSNWEGTVLETISRGPIAYSDIADVYASTKIVIDDANIATKNWGSCNSRVFDSIAAGCLLITNGDKGTKELFGDLVPTFSDKQSLTETINYWIENEEERKERVKALQDILTAKHTYAHRANVVGQLLTSGKVKPRISIKCAAKYNERENWGDYHFATSLADELRKCGFTVRVDCRESWQSGLGHSDDAVIVIRGIIPYTPRTHQKNIMWLISHPSDITVTELEQYDHVYVASKIHTEILQSVTSVPVEELLQCTDINRFKPGSVPSKVKSSRNPLFVGNSRGVFRTAVKWSIESEADIDLYGKGWEQFVNDDRLKGDCIPNDVLASFYESSSVVLCDHWDDMKRLGYLSNRAFDVLACGSWLAVDDVEGMEDILPGGYTKYETREEFEDILKTKDFKDQKGRTKRAKWVAENHSFAVRAQTFAEKLSELLPEQYFAENED